MRGAATVLIGALALAGCAAGGAPSASSAPPARKAMPHADARFLVTYGGERYRVNVRYVPLIDESVIAVRQGPGEAGDEGWPTLEVEARDDYSRVLNFADEGYRRHVIEIAGAVQAEGGICPDGTSIAMATDREGDVRTLYRRNRQVWVVFALCPEAAAESTPEAA